MLSNSHFISPSEDQLTSALEAWTWIGLDGKAPILVTAFADVFFSSLDGIWFLDTIEGTLQRVCDSRDELQSRLASTDFQDHYLLGGFVERAVREGSVLGPTQCYDFILHPRVGGPIDYSNIERRDFLVALHIRGQIHEQARNLPDGARISKFVHDETPPKKHPWWKRW